MVFGVSRFGVSRSVFLVLSVSGFHVHGFRCFTVRGFAFRIFGFKGFGFPVRVSRLGFSVSPSGFEVLVFFRWGFRVSPSGYGVFGVSR